MNKLLFLIIAMTITSSLHANVYEVQAYPYNSYGKQNENRTIKSYHKLEIYNTNPDNKAESYYYQYDLYYEYYHKSFRSSVIELNPGERFFIENNFYMDVFIGNVGNKMQAIRAKTTIIKIPEKEPCRGCFSYVTGDLYTDRQF